jgi:hypothetical protein
MKRKILKNNDIETLLREFVQSLLIKEEGPLFPISSKTSYDPAIAGELLSDFSDWLGEKSRLLIQYRMEPYKKKAAEVIDNIDYILKFIQTYTPKESHIVPNLGKIDWSKAFFGTQIPNLGKIYYWQSLTSASGLAMLSGYQIKYEEAIKLGAISVGNNPGIQQQILSDLTKSGFIKSKYHSDKIKIILTAKSQADVDAHPTINNQKYYFVVIDSKNPNIHAISTDLRQQDFVYVENDVRINNPYEGLPIIDSVTGQFLKKDVDVETRGSTDLLSLPNMAKFCIETLRIFEIAPESYVGKLIEDLPPGARANYLRCLRAVLISSSVVSSIPGVQLTPVGAVAGGLFVASSMVEASINFSLNNYGQGLFSLLVAPLYGVSYKMSFVALQTRAADLQRLAAAVPNSTIKLSTSSAGPTFSELATAIRAIDDAGITISKIPGQNGDFVISAATRAGVKIAELDEAWLKIFTGLSTNRNMSLALKLPEFIAWYDGTTAWLRTVTLTALGASLDILFAGATVDQFTEFLAEKDKEMSDKIRALSLPTLNVDGLTRSALLDTDIDKLFNSSFGQKHIKNRSIVDTKPVTLVDLQTGNYVEGIPHKIFENLGIFGNNNPDLLDQSAFYENLTPEQAATIKVVAADSQIYSSLSKLIKTSGNEAVRSKKLVFLKYYINEYEFLRVLPRT